MRVRVSRTDETKFGPEHQPIAVVVTETGEIWVRYAYFGLSFDAMVGFSKVVGKIYPFALHSPVLELIPHPKELSQFLERIYNPYPIGYRD